MQQCPNAESPLDAREGAEGAFVVRKADSSQILPRASEKNSISEGKYWPPEGLTFLVEMTIYRGFQLRVSVKYQQKYQQKKM
jgi:hypothetical protein